MSSARMPTVTKTRVRVATRSKGAWAASLSADALTVIVGLAACESVKLIGTIPGSEIVLIPVLPILLVVRFRKITRGKLKYLFVLLGLWLFGQVVTDIYRGAEFADWARGDSAIVFMALDLAGLAGLLSGSERRKALFILSFALGSLIATRISPNYLFQADPWKFGYSEESPQWWFSLVAGFFARRRYTVAGMLLLGIAGVNLFFNYRSPVLFLLVTMGVMLPMIPERIGRLRILPPQGTGLRIAVLIVIVLTMGFIAELVTTGLSASGALGEDARQKNEMQANSALGFLLGGRPEIFVSTRAVFDSPILGHGSNAKDPKYLEMYEDMLLQAGLRQGEYQEQTVAEVAAIPTHSHLMGAWVTAGVLGALFWGYVFSCSCAAQFGRQSYGPLCYPATAISSSSSCGLSCSPPSDTPQGSEKLFCW